MPKIPTKQLKISNKKNSNLQENLDNGVFSIIQEISLPDKDQSILLALEDSLEMMKAIAAHHRICAVSVSESTTTGLSAPIAEVCKLLRKKSRKKEILLNLSGRGMTLPKLTDILTSVSGKKVGYISVHTGAALPDHPMTDKGIPKDSRDDYLDSLTMLDHIKQVCPTISCGVRINPYKYTLEDVYLQYYRMMKGVSSGSGFLLTQVGWDMKKLHELQWYQRLRNVDTPVIAKLMYTYKDDVTAILNHEHPGLVISRELGAQIQREFSDVTSGTKRALRRLSLQVAGCRLLGYSGVQLCGLNDETSLELAMIEIEATIAEFTDYNSWLDAWNEFNHNIEFSPAGERYYIFDNLLEKDNLDYSTETVMIASKTLEQPDYTDQLRYKLAKHLGLDHRDGMISHFLKKLLCGVRGSKNWHLNKTGMICAAACPKGLEEGVCEESRSDGTCEFGHQKCFFHHVMKIDQWQDQIDLLEYPYEKTDI